MDRGQERRLSGNPFYILALPVSCGRGEVEREGQKWLGMLELGLAGAGAYRSPIGTHERTPELVRWAMAELRDPDRRLGHELWAQLEPRPAAPSAGTPGVSAAAAAASAADAAWPEGMQLLGWARP